MSDTTTNTRQLRQRLTFAAFGMFGAMFGVWQVLVADLQLALDLSPGEFGFAITAGFVASFPVMFLGGRLIDLFGVRPMLMMTTSGLSLALLGISQVEQYVLLLPLMMLFFGSSGGYDVVINAMAVRVEQERGDAIMSYFHAAYSGLSAILALLTGLSLAAALPFRTGLLLVSGLLLLFAGVVWRSDAFRTTGTHHTADSDSDARTSLPLPNRLVIAVLGVIALFTFLTEGALETWSATYLRLTLDLPPVQGAAAPATFHLAMLTGRLFSGGLVARMGGYRFIRMAGSVAAIGLGLALATTAVPLILSGLLLAGLALAGVVPVVFSRAGQLAPQQVGRATAMITTIGYGGFLVGPSLIGGLADALTLRGALAVLIVLCGLLVPLSLYAERRPGESSA